MLGGINLVGIGRNRICVTNGTSVLHLLLPRLKDRYRGGGERSGRTAMVSQSCLLGEFYGRGRSCLTEQDTNKQKTMVWTVSKEWHLKLLSGLHVYGHWHGCVSTCLHQYFVKTSLNKTFFLICQGYSSKQDKQRCLPSWRLSSKWPPTMIEADVTVIRVRLAL